MTVTAVDLRSIEAALPPVAMIPCSNGPERYDACVLLVVIPNVPLYANDGSKLEFRFQLVVPVDSSADTEVEAVKNDPANNPPDDKTEAIVLPV